ncbi:MAG: LuxR C-terminal-related transcriptional regulator [Nesterenkonia sp.]
MRLFIGAETVKTHMSAVLSKLQLRNRIEAVAFAHRHGIVAE